MTACEVCGKETFMPFICSYCNGVFCEEHHIPEFHHCKSPRDSRFKPPLNQPRKMTRDKERRNLPLFPYDYQQVKPLRIKYAKNRISKKSILGILFLLALLVFIIILLYVVSTYRPPNYFQPIQPFNLGDVKEEIFRLINEKRVADGLPELANDSLLTVTAQSWSESMAQKMELEHGNFGSRMNQIGYLNNYMCGEIIAFYSSSNDLAITLVDGWINSPLHKEIMFTAKNGKMGIGLAKGADGYYATVDFIFW